MSALDSGFNCVNVKRLLALAEIMRQTRIYLRVLASTVIA